MIGNAMHICGWWVPENDPYFGPLIRKTAGQMDTEVIVAALNHVTERGRAIDVGAHIGTWTRPLAGCFEEVVAIEPDEEMFRFLLTNTAEIGNVRPLRAAAGCAVGRVIVTNIGFNSGESRVAPANGVIGGQWAPAFMIDSLGLDRVGLIKIDVEGAEHDVIRGAAQTIARCRPVVVVEEGHAERAPTALLKFLGMVEMSRHPIGPNLPVENVVLAWPPAPS